MPDTYTAATVDCIRCLLSCCALRSQLDQSGIEKLRSMAVGCRYPAGSVIFEMGDELDRLFIITQGLVSLDRLTPDGKRQITGFLGPGDLLGGIKRSAGAHCTAHAMTEVEACAFDRERFGEFLHHHPDLCFNLLVTATDEIEAQHDHAMLLAGKQARERLAAFLLVLTLRWCTDDDNPDTVHIKMSRSDIADHLGLTIETVSRAFAQLKRLGLIEFRGPKTVKLKKIAGLHHLAGFEELPQRRMSIGL